MIKLVPPRSETRRLGMEAGIAEDIFTIEIK